MVTLQAGKRSGTAQRSEAAMRARIRTAIALRSNEVTRNAQPMRSLKVVLYGEPVEESPF